MKHAAQTLFHQVVNFASSTVNNAVAVPGRKNLPKASRGMIANASNDITIPFFSDVLENSDDTLVKKGGGKGLALYDEIERDTHAWAVLQKRKKVLVSREWMVKPGGEDQIDLDAAEFLECILKELPFDRICEDLLDAILKGFAVSEIVWKRDGNYIKPDYLVSHEQRRFKFDREWKLRLLTMQSMTEGEALPDRKFIVHRHGVKGNNPYGLGLGTRLFWPVLFKREGVTFWMTFLEKFGAPTVWGKTPFGMTEAEEKKLLASLTSFVRDSAIVTPVGVEVDLVEAKRSGTVSHRDWCQYWDSQMSIATLGETLTTDVQDKGSRAAGEVHLDVLQMLVDADGDLLADTLRDTLIKWIVLFNFPGAKLPSIWRIRPANEQAEAEAESKKAEAAEKTEKALRQIVATSAKFEKDEDAREFIQELAPIDLNADRLDMFVAARFAFAHNAEQQQRFIHGSKKNF